MTELKVLPCYPCPHKGACCSYGASLTPEEAVAVRAAHGEGALVETGDVEDPVRTRVVAGKCYFLVEGLCRIHGEAYYPKTCAGFPWTDETGAPYIYDQTICPEFKS